jgi:hypothetical protein
MRQLQDVPTLCVVLAFWESRRGRVQLQQPPASTLKEERLKMVTLSQETGCQWISFTVQSPAEDMIPLAKKVWINDTMVEPYLSTMLQVLFIYTPKSLFALVKLWLVNNYLSNFHKVLG